MPSTQVLFDDEELPLCNPNRRCYHPDQVEEKGPQCAVSPPATPEEDETCQGISSDDDDSSESGTSSSSDLEHSFYNYNMKSRLTTPPPNTHNLADGDRILADVSSIRFSQPSIYHKLANGTRLKDGIENIKRGEKYVIEVDCVNGELVALNNRTLYCYKKAGVKYATVVFTMGALREKGRKVFGFDINVRHNRKDQ